MNTFQRLREVLSALNFDQDDLPLDQDLARLLKLATESPLVANFILQVQAQPDLLDAMWDEGPVELAEELRSVRIPWSKVYRLVPQLAAAIAAMEKPS